ncbi:MAG: hypothetical protein EKK42_24505 [Pseudonocardiaceae bacterium]|nr:MAG: hypothetical protein EKK42_24505 [Pseudonocardiaceae bacterium]
MPTINLRDSIPRVNQETVSLPKNLARIGVKTPQALTRALEMARWKLTAPDLSALTQAVTDAQTEDEYNARAFELAQARGVVEYMNRDVAFRDGRRRLNADRIHDAVKTHGDALMAEVIEFYNSHAAKFSAAVATLPDLTVSSVFDLSPEQASALQEAQSEAAELSAGLAAYDGLSKSLGYTIRSANGPDARSAFERATQIGEYPDAETMSLAADLINLYAKGDGHAASYAPLAPHVGVVLKGGTLRLAHPAQAKAHLNDLLAQ